MKFNILTSSWSERIAVKGEQPVPGGLNAQAIMNEKILLMKIEK